MWDKHETTKTTRQSAALEHKSEKSEARWNRSAKSIRPQSYIMLKRNAANATPYSELVPIHLHKKPSKFRRRYKPLWSGDQNRTTDTNITTTWNELFVMWCVWGDNNNINNNNEHTSTALAPARATAATTTDHDDDDDVRNTLGICTFTK